MAFVPGVASLPQPVRAAIERLLPPRPIVVSLETRAEVAQMLTDETFARVEADARANTAEQASAQLRATFAVLARHLEERLDLVSGLSETERHARTNELEQVKSLLLHGGSL